jgi:hypothetical protein
MKAHHKMELFMRIKKKKLFLPFFRLFFACYENKYEREKEKILRHIYTMKQQKEV